MCLCNKKIRQVANCARTGRVSPEAVPCVLPRTVVRQVAREIATNLPYTVNSIRQQAKDDTYEKHFHGASYFRHGASGDYIAVWGSDCDGAAAGRGPGLAGSYGR